MRALRNTTLTLLQSGRSEEALQWCDRLEKEVHDQDSAAVFRAAACLNLGRWSEARELAGRYVRLWPEENFVAALAAYELGELQDALARWLHATIQKPRAARMLVGIPRTTEPAGMKQVRDHNTGVDLTRTLATYLEGHRSSLLFFTGIMESAEVAALIREHDAVRLAQRENRSEDRTAYRRLMEMQTPEFAQARAVELAHLLGGEA
jgi:tetratricopeptide (TPR) repeat protein